MDDGKHPASTTEFWVRVGILAVLGGGVTNLGYNVSGLNRPDPFTGSDGRELEQRVNKKIEDLRAMCNKIDDELHTHLERGERGWLMLDTLWERHIRSGDKGAEKSYEVWKQMNRPWTEKTEQ